jgi:dihydrolipoamide dehydrogenase
MQGRIAIWHALGEAVAPLALRDVSANVFTDPEIATVGWSQAAADSSGQLATTATLPLKGNPRAKMQGITDGFVKLTCRTDSRVILGGVVVAPRASELVHVLALAVAQRLTVDQLSHAFTVYPSLSGSIAEAAHRLHLRA